MARLTIAIDIDDVLSLTSVGFSEFSNRRWGLKTRPQDYSEEWAVFWGVHIDDANKYVEDYHASDVYYYYEHFPDSFEVLKALKDRYNLVVVTSRRKEQRVYTKQWLDERFPGVFDAIHYVGIWDVPHIHGRNVEHLLNQTKAATCREIGADYLIDDQIKHCAGAQEAGIQALLFGGYEWSHFEQIPEGVEVVHSWKEVKEYFDAKG